MSVTYRLRRRLALVICIVVALLASSPASTAQARQRSEASEGSEVYAPGTGASYESSDRFQPLDISLECSGQSSQHLVWTYERNGGGPGDAAYLRCGSDTNWGLRHIEDRHEADWGNRAAVVGAAWDDMADFCIGQTLLAPSSVTYRANNDTWRFSAPIQIRDVSGQVIARFTTAVVVADNSENIITSFPLS